MSTASESSVVGTATAQALAGGLNTLSYDQTIPFALYKRVVLPLDGYVFWVRQSSLTGVGAAYNVPEYNATPYGAAAPGEALAPDPITAQGSLHRTTNATQMEADSNTTALMVFTSLSPVSFLDAIAPDVIYVATDPAGRLYAFSSRRSYYQQSGLHHYLGEAVRSTMLTQVLSDPTQLRASQAVVSNSMPIWLALGTNQAGVPLFPSRAVPLNQPPPYVAVHIPDESPDPLQMVPFIDQESNHYQLVKDRVRFTAFGLRNDQALAFQDYILQQPTNDLCPWGLMNSPVMRDQRSRFQPEYQTIEQCKVMDLEISYYQQSVREIARQLIESAAITITLSGGITPPLPPPFVAMLLIDGSGNELLIDGSGNRLRIS